MSLISAKIVNWVKRKTDLKIREKDMGMEKNEI